MTAAFAFTVAREPLVRSPRWGRLDCDGLAPEQGAIAETLRPRVEPNQVLALLTLGDVNVSPLSAIRLRQIRHQADVALLLEPQFTAS